MKYEWRIIFDAESDKDANEQIEEAMSSFRSVHSDDVVQIEDEE